MALQDKIILHYIALWYVYNCNL